MKNFISILILGLFFFNSANAENRKVELDKLFAQLKNTKNLSFEFKQNINENIESLNISNSAAIVFHHLQFLKKCPKWLINYQIR